MQSGALLAALETPPVQQWPASSALNQAQEITGLAYDSRKVTPGALFIAVPGSHTDGRAYLADAARRGAVVALGPTLDGILPPDAPTPLPYIIVQDVLSALADLACAFYAYPARQLCTIGVTGTDGKTTTSNLIHTILREAGIHAGLMTTANFRLDGQEWENTTRQSTLEALEVQQLLRRMVDEGITHAVIEATSHGLELQRVRGCAFDVGVVTNITQEHLEFHKTLENYRRAKARLFEMLDPARDKGCGARPAAILNRDDVSYEILRPYCRVPIIDYAIDQPAAIRAVDVRLDASRTRFRAILPDTEVDIETQLVGRFNVSNCLAAIATAWSQGIAPEIIARALATVTGVSGRMERIDEGQPFSVIVDYAHTPDSLAKVLATLRPLTSGKLLLVFGSAGERDVLKRPIMGRIAAQMADFFVITDEDPREEDSEKILREIASGSAEAGKREGHDFLCIADRTQAIATALARAQAGDTILLAGKGHEQSIIIGREKIPWDDRRVARERLRSL
ncbi:MAG TPA: UDP-N-acetylmuramoyl-L-alanyl-D-glutamate--2,6-diaminopimelate ligase [Ktedonobacteraceae bacterium]|nr:UDP-N-acetylmuramoyl-L-alanyl-D-glutamate--2,6-diaminopimelate ligase [Ktedonobacteraceae bacterium]